MGSWNAADVPILSLVSQIVNSEALEARFGSWPSFHDAEVLAVRLDSGQRSDGRVRLELDVHVFSVDGQLPDGRFNFVLHTVVTLEFAGVEDVDLQGFWHQNVLDDLVIRKLAPDSPWSARVQVELPANNGLAGAFRCEDVTVLAVEPHVPGPHSVYSR
jgi:Immunity protein 50